jgi:archaemetzincin
MYDLLVRLAVFLALVACSDDKPRATPPAMVPKSSLPPDANPRVAAIGSTAALSPELQRAFDPAGDFEPLPDPKPGDWLAEHREKPQSYDDYLNVDTNVPTSARHIIYLQPIGDFPADAPPLGALSQIVHAFFTLEVRVLPAVKIANVPTKTRINPHTHKRQLRTPEILDWLAKRVPDDAFAVQAITMEDLYPDESWNFVFGQASLGDRVGVQSFAREDPTFFGNPRGADWKRLALRRAAATMVHEITHMFGITHCVYWQCEINGSNHQAEADSRPLHACPVDLRKLHSAIGFDPAAREEELARVLRALGITDEASWSERRAKWIRTGNKS